MKKQEVFRLYTFSDATLVTKGLEKVAFMQRDATQFDSYGITAMNITNLKNSLNTFADRLTDVEALGDQTQATENKDRKAEELRVAIADVMTRVRLTFPEGSPKYRKFGTDTLSKQIDAELHITAKRVVRVGTELLAELASNGLTQDMLDTISTLADKFADAIVAMKIEIGDRDIEQEDRVEAGNAIYTILAKYTSLGQSIWETSDVAKFNDYVLYNTISGEAETPASPTP